MKFSFNLNSWFSQKFGLGDSVYHSVLILGMHRSGTSCLTGMLKQYGLYVGQVSNSNKFNKKGNQESSTVISINDQLLSANGGSWYEPVQVQSIPSVLQQQIKEFKQQMRDSDKIWGIKDPRMLFCLSAWLDPNTTFIGTFRHPMSVVSSLEKRQQAGILKINRKVNWKELWFQYNYQLISLYRKNPFPIINFDWESERYRSAVRHIAHTLSLNSEGDDFFEENLRDEFQIDHIQNVQYGELYQELVKIAETEEEKLQNL